MPWFSDNHHMLILENKIIYTITENLINMVHPSLDMLVSYVDMILTK